MVRTFLLIGITLVAFCCCAAPAGPVGAPDSTAVSVADVITPTAVVSAPAVGAAEKWIEVDLAAQRVRLREGSQILSEHMASTGAAISPETTTYPGVYQVQQKIKGPIENVPGVFLSDILIFDLMAGAGIHSMPMDKEGKVLDSTLGKPLTAGCVRVGDSTTVFEFARLGTIIWVH